MKACGFTILFLMLCLQSAYGQVQTAAQLEDQEFDGRYFPGGSEDRYGVIVLTGSGGGRADDVAMHLARLGFNALSLAYFDRSGSSRVPETLELIPLEYFEAPKEWLMSQPDTRNDGVILFGLSKGAELALVLSSMDEDYKAVVALAPSHVVWQGNPRNFAGLLSAPSSWSYQGEGLPFVPYVSTEEKDRLGFSNRHEASLTNQAAVSAARIKVENIVRPILLLSGSEDSNWPAEEMGNEICRVANSDGATSCIHKVVNGGDHLLSQHQEVLYQEVEQFLGSLPR